MRFDMAALIQGNGLKRLANGSLVVVASAGGGKAESVPQQQQPQVPNLQQQQLLQPTHHHQLQVAGSMFQSHQVVIIHNNHLGHHMATGPGTQAVVVCGPGTLSAVPVVVTSNPGTQAVVSLAQSVASPAQVVVPTVTQSNPSGAQAIVTSSVPGTQPASDAPDGGNGATTIPSPPASEADSQQQNCADEPEVDIVINNVVCSFNVRCHLNLRQIALTGCNVEYRRENGMVTMKLRKPYTTASIWSSGKITCTGATTVEQSRMAARRYARSLQKLGFKTRFTNFRIVNVLGTCSMPFGIKITSFSERYREAEYEPELHPGVTYKMKKPKATLKIFATGSITVTAPSVTEVQEAIEAIYPRVVEFRKERTQEEEQAARQRQAQSGGGGPAKRRRLSSTAAAAPTGCYQSTAATAVAWDDEADAASGDSSEEC